jgi:hexosaminidase
MKYFNSKNLWIVVFIIITYACQNRTPKDLLKDTIIPKPSSVAATNSSFELNSSTGIYYQSNQEGLKKIGVFFAEILNPSTGFNLSVSESDKTPSKNAIYLDLSGDDTLGKEGYELNIAEDLITISAAEPAGVFMVCKL